MSREVLVELFTCCVAPQAGPHMAAARPRFTPDMIGAPQNFQHLTHVGATDVPSPAALAGGIATINNPSSPSSPASSSSSSSSASSSSSSSGPSSRLPSPTTTTTAAANGTGSGAGLPKHLTIQMNSKGSGFDSMGNPIVNLQPVHVPHLVNARSVSELSRRINATNYWWIIKLDSEPLRAPLYKYTIHLQPSVFGMEFEVYTL